MSDTEYHPSNLSFHVGANTLNLLLYELFMFFHVLEILRFDRAIIFSPILKSNLLVNLIIKRGA